MEAHPIIWTIDPYQANAQVWRRSKELAQCASRIYKSPVQPVFVADRGLVSPLSAFDEKTVREAVNDAKNRLDRRLKTFHAARKVLQPRVLISSHYGPRAETNELKQFARKQLSPVILTATSARKGIQRFLEGSFAESLVSRSSVPVLLVNPDTKPIRSMRRILFASDLSPLSRKAFRKLCEFARAAHASIEIVSVIPQPLQIQDAGIAAPAGAGAFIRPDLLEEKKKLWTRRGKSWLKLAEEIGVKAEFYLDDRPGLAVFERILRDAAHDKVDLIAIAARGDTSKAHFFGSTTQRVIRGSHVPVWVYHAHS